METRKLETLFPHIMSIVAMFAGVFVFLLGTGVICVSETSSTWVSANMGYGSVELSFGSEYREGYTFLKVFFVLYLLAIFFHFVSLSLRIGDEGNHKKRNDYVSLGCGAVSLVSGLCYLLAFTGIPPSTGYIVYPSDGFLVPGGAALLSGILTIIVSIIAIRKKWALKAKKEEEDING